MDGRRAAAVLLAEQGAGSGTFVSLALVLDAPTPQFSPGLATLDSLAASVRIVGNRRL
jgi:hypothetical protein